MTRSSSSKLSMHCLESLVMMWDIVRYKIEREGVVTASLGGEGGRW